MTGTHDATVAPPEPQPQPEPLPEPSPEPVNDTGPAAATQATENKKKDAANHPLVRAVLETFPGATIEEVRDAADVPDGEKTKE